MFSSIGCQPDDPAAEVDDLQPSFVSDIVAAENLILELTIELKKLNQAILKPGFPASSHPTIFAESVSLIDINQETTLGKSYEGLSTQTQQYEIGAATTASADSVLIWSAVLDQVDQIQHGGFYFFDGQFSDKNQQTFDTRLGFNGLAKLKNGNSISIAATQKVQWSLDPAAAKNRPGRWKISSWEQTEFETSERDDTMFVDVFEQAIPVDQQEDFIKSKHDEFVIKIFQGSPLGLPFPEVEPFFTTDSTMYHPSVSVVDINGDGWDDLYVMTRWQKNRMFVNQKDGTFKESASELGLAVDRTTSAIFADFDNDGDKDVFLGRCYASSLLMINQKGRFRDVTSENIKQELPGYVTSLSAADFNNDGLLDLYLSTYVPIGAQVQTVDSAAEFMPRGDAMKLIRNFKSASQAEIWLDRPGPPNRLLVNVGNGRFETSEAIPEVWAHTFQSTWSDFDEDGDVDLYLSNDFAPDSLFQNNQEEGFTEITQKTGGDEMRGYGMGVTWGDYDNDGWQDLYVSNMYSKAGKRIIKQMPGQLDQRYGMSANGNRLFRNQGGRSFELVSGEQPGQARVTKAGWSWGGQFCDFDNDGYLDIYVASGFYTAPDDISCDVDL